MVAINGDLTEGLLHFDAQQMIKATGMSLQLKLSRLNSPSLLSFPFLLFFLPSRSPWPLLRYLPLFSFILSLLSHLPPPFISLTSGLLYYPFSLSPSTPSPSSFFSLLPYPFFSSSLSPPYLLTTHPLSLLPQFPSKESLSRSYRPSTHIDRDD